MSYEEVTDFTSEDRGRYRPADVEGFTADEIEAKIIAALTDSDGHDDGRAFRTLPRIKEHAELSKASDISEILFNMIEDGKIKKHENGDFTCYFLADEKPKRFWRNGDGTVGAEFPEEDAPHPFADQIGQPAVPVAYERPILDQKPYSKVPIEILPDELEEAMAEHGSISAAAKELEVGYSTLYSKMNGQAALKQAADRGLKRYKAANPKPEKTPKQEKTMSAPAPAKAEKIETTQTHSRKAIVHTNEQIEAASAANKSFAATAKSFGYKQPSNLQKKMDKDPDMQAAYDRGAARRSQSSESSRSGVATKTVDERNHKLAQTIDLKTVEELAWLGKTINQAAEALKIPYDSFVYHVKGRAKNTVIKEAWERGLVRRKKALENLTDELADVSTETVAERHDRELAETATPETETIAETTSEDPQSPRSSIVMEIQANVQDQTEAETLEAEPANEITNDVDEDTTPRFESPIERFNQIDPFDAPVPIHTYERPEKAVNFPANEIPQNTVPEPIRSIRVRNIKAAIDEYPNADGPSSIMQEIFDIQREAALEIDPALTCSTRSVPLTSTGEIFVGFAGNYFDLSPGDRAFLEQMAARMDGYGIPTPRKRTALQRFADWMAGGRN